MPSVSGATSSRKTLSVFASEPPTKMLAWTTAPYATTSSGLIDFFGAFPLKRSFRSWTTFGVRVEPQEGQCRGSHPCQSSRAENMLDRRDHLELVNAQPFKLRPRGRHRSQCCHTDCRPQSTCSHSTTGSASTLACGPPHTIAAAVRSLMTPVMFRPVCFQVLFYSFLSYSL